MVKKIVAFDPDKHLIYVLKRADLLEFHQSFKDKQFTDFNDFYTLSDQELVISILGLYLCTVGKLI